MSDNNIWQSDALINIQRFLDKYSSNITTRLPLVDVMRFRINAILGSEPEQLQWSETFPSGLGSNTIPSRTRTGNCECGETGHFL